MFLNPFHRAITCTSEKVSLRTVLILAFVLQILGPVGLVGYLLFRNGQKAVEDLAGQIVDEVSDRIDLHLDVYLTMPQQVNQLNLFAVDKNLSAWTISSDWDTIFGGRCRCFPT